MADQPLHMWSYWCEKYGTVAAFRDYYPDLARTNPVLAHALSMIQIGELAVQAEMKRLQRAEDDDDFA